MSVVVLRHESKALKSNPLKDPHVRDLHVIVPDDLDPKARVPCLWYLQGYSSVGRSMLADDPWQEGLEERLVRLRNEKKIGPLIVALPDAFTKFGGSQYISSSAHGDYETYLVEELRPLVESRFSISEHAIFGKSSGGFGAIVHAMRHPEVYRAVASHAGDMGFRLAYTHEIPLLMSAVERFKGVENFVREFDRSVKKKSGSWLAPMSILAMAAAYSPDPEKPLGIALPFDLESGQIDEKVFARWLAWDPVQLIDEPKHREALRQSKLVFLDCGSKDEYNAHWGARGFTKKLREYGVPHEYEEFDDGHRSTSYRLDVSIPKLWNALKSSV